MARGQLLNRHYRGSYDSVIFAASAVESTFDQPPHGLGSEVYRVLRQRSNTRRIAPPDQRAQLQPQC